MKRTSVIFAGFIIVAIGLRMLELSVESFYESSIRLKTWPKTEYSNLACKYSTEQVRNILDQPFTYLGKGRQFFVFESACGKYVLKFIKCQRVNTPPLVKHFPLPKVLDDIRDERLQEKQKRIEGIFSSSFLAATELSENTGVIYAHLSTNPDVEKEVEVIDKLGRSHRILLDNYPFVLQEKAEYVIPTFDRLINKRKYDEVQKRMDQLIKLLVNDAKAKVYDVDSGAIMRDNIGFLQDKAIHVDIGTFIRQDNDLTPAYLHKHLRRLDPLLSWISEKDPKLAQVFQEKIRQAICQEAAF